MYLCKKILTASIALGLVTTAAIPAATVAYAAGESNTDSEIILTLTDAKERLLEKNTDLELLENNLDKLYYQLRSSREDLENLEDSQEDYGENLEDLKAKLTNLENEKAAFIADQEDPLTPPLSTGEYINRLIDFDIRISQLNQTINSLTNNIGSLNDSEDSLEANIDSIRNNIDLQEENKAITEEKLKYNLEKIYIQILSLDLEIIKKESTLSLAELAFYNENLKFQLGLTQVSNVKSTEETYLFTKNNLDSLRNQQEQLMNELKVLMGYPTGTKVKLEDIPLNEITLPSYQDGLNEVLKDGVEINYQEMLCDNQKDYIDDLEDKYDGSENEIRNEKYKLEEYEINLKKVMTTTGNTYYNNYHDFELLGDSVDLLEEQLTHAESLNKQSHMQYDLGVLSKEDLAAKDDAYLQAQLTFKQKQYEYAAAASAYYMAEQGYLFN